MVTPKVSNIAIVILAAGESARLGSPKQLLNYNGKNLLRHAVDEALHTGCESVFVVLGANIDSLRNEVRDKPVIIVENAKWQEGMASSIRCGLESIMKTILRPDSVIFTVCDQPFVSSDLFLRLAEGKQVSGLPIVACIYGDKPGTPALFHKSFFPALLALKGDTGARKLMTDNMEKVWTISFPEGVTDIDTAEDYELLKKAT